MGSNSVTHHPAQVNTPCLNPSQIGQHLIYTPWRNGRLSWIGLSSLTPHPTQYRPFRRRSSQPITWLTDKEGQVDLGDQLHTKIIYPSTDGHTSKY